MTPKVPCEVHPNACAHRCFDCFAKLQERVESLESALADAIDMLGCQSCAEDSRCYSGHEGKREEIQAVLEAVLAASERRGTGEP